MVDTHDLFKKLGCGAKFNLKRFKDDAEKFHILPSSAPEKLNGNTVEALDFFGSNKKKNNEPVVNNEVKSSITEKNDKEKKKKKKRKREIVQENPIDDDNDNEIDIMSGHKKKVKPKKAKVSKERIIQEHIEKTNLFRKEKRIYVHGPDVPDPLKKFEELKSNNSEIILKNIQDNGYNDPTPIQMQVITAMLQKRELLACAPTGSGKTLAFIIPILQQLKEPRKNGFRAVVLSPTRELALQIHREFTRMNVGIGLRIHVLTKSKAASNNFGPKSTMKFDILISTPNRLVHMLNQENSLIRLDKVEWLILDEGDKLFEDGQTGFREQIATIYKACDNPSVKHALFSATLANNIEEWCKIHLDDAVRITVGTRNSAATDVDQELMFVGQESGKLLAMRQIIQKGFQPPVLVFVQSKDRAKELFNELIYDGLNIDVIHSDRTQAQRENTVKAFRTCKIWILIATELMGRGIDFKGVNLVINYDFPPNAVSYIHRVGRTGRAGRKGKAITMFTEEDVINLRSIANVMKSSGCDIPEWIMALKKPNRNTQKKLSKTPIERKTIKTVSEFDQDMIRKKKQMIEMSKAKKNAPVVNNGDNVDNVENGDNDSPS